MRDPDRDEARDWLRGELARPGYDQRESVVERVRRWFTELIPDLPLGSGALPSWFTWVFLAGILLAAVALVAFTTRARWRRAALDARQGTRSGAVLEGRRLTAADYRARARAALDTGDHDAAVLDGYRALTAHAIERTLLDDRPGHTAHEVAVSLGPVFPDRAPDLTWAADRFDAVRYGDRRADAAEARAMLELDTALADLRPALEGARR
ncbi:DUF4129 domain-containing protein [Ornithinimicrobium sp. Y1694]|uniref:DUF4129 domain-containing protein n=1 Tax=Ornithinimicrobium sp. Y1694 TaxID=3418590 RepID=UPI003CF90880